MATANFHARIERIQKAQASMAAPPTKPVREPGVASVIATKKQRKRRNPVKDTLMSLIFGVILGCLVSVLHVGLSMEDSAWGPGTALHDILQYPALVGLASAPALMISAVFVAAKRPAYALFALGYISGAALPLMM